MARSTFVPVPSVPPLIAEIVDIEDKDGPRAAYAALQTRLQALRHDGEPVPPPLVRLEQRLLVDCCAMSQGR